MGNWNSTFGLQGFDGGDDSLYRSSSLVARGAATGFTAVIAVSFEGPLEARKWYVGNDDGDRGWAIMRAADNAATADSPGTVELEFFIRSDAATFATATISLAKDGVFGRTAVLGLQVDASGTIVSAWLNGALVSSAVALTPITPGTIPLAVGNEAGTGLSGGVDRIISVAYTPQILSEQEMIDVFEGFRELGTLAQPGVEAFGGFVNCWDFFSNTTPTALAPSPIPSSGSNTTTLVYQSTTVGLQGKADLDPDFVAGSLTGSVTPTPQAINIYISAANGDDANDGLTPATAVQTFTRVWELLPSTLTSPFVVHIDGGNAATLTTSYDWVQPPATTFVGDDAFIVLYGDGAGQGTNDGFFTVATHTLDVGTTSSSLVVSGGGLAVRSYRSFVVEVVDGPAASQLKTIGTNDATTIELLSSCSDSNANTLTPVAGNTIRVVRPNAVLNIDTDSLYGQRGVQMHAVNIAWETTGSDELRLFNTQVSWFGVELRGTLRTANENVTFYLGCGAPTADSSSLYRPSTSALLWEKICTALGTPVAITSGAWDGWGLAQTSFGAGLRVPFTNNELASAFQPYKVYGFIAGGNLIGVGPDTEYALYGFHLRSLWAYNGARYTLDTLPLDLVPCYMGLYNDAVSASTLIFASDGCVIRTAQFNSGTIVATQNTGAPVLQASVSSTIFMWFALVATTTAGGAAIVAFENGRILFNFDNHVITANAALASGFTLDSESMLELAGGSGSLTITSSLANTVARSSLFTSRPLTLTVTTVGESALSLSSGSRASINGNMTLRSSVSNNARGTLFLTGVGTSFSSTGGTLDVRNTNVGANANGVYVQRGAAFQALSTCTITTAGANPSYGVALSGACRAIFNAQPTGVVGDAGARDFLVDATPYSDASVVAVAATGNGGSLAVVG